jgi:hypothetical protein
MGPVLVLAQASTPIIVSDATKRPEASIELDIARREPGLGGFAFEEISSFAIGPPHRV